MTLDSPRDFVVVDTSVMSYLASGAEPGGAYRALLAGRTIALSFFVRTELEGGHWAAARRDRLDALYRECVPLQPSDATSIRYNEAHHLRREMRRSRVSRVSDTDLWIIAHAAEYGVPYMSHDRGACELARALGVEVLTALQDG